MMDIKIINIIEKLLKTTIYWKFFKGIYNIHKCFCYVPFSVISNSCMFLFLWFIIINAFAKGFFGQLMVFWNLIFQHTCGIFFFFFGRNILYYIVKTHMWICSIFFFFVFCFVIFKSDGLVTLGTPCWHYELMGIVCCF